MKKRLLSLLLAMVMVVTMLPMQALAEEADEPPVLTETEEVTTEEVTTAVEETEAPTEETEAPTEGTEAPTEETEAPTEETEAPTEETEAPTEETEAPTEETEVPTEETEAPTEETDAPTEETDAPTEETEAPTEETEAPEDEVGAQEESVIPRPEITLLSPGSTEELTLKAGESMPLEAVLSTATQVNDGINWAVTNKDGSECTMAAIRRNEDDTLVLQAVDSVAAPTMVTVTASQPIPEGYTENTIAYSVSFDVTIGDPLVLKITNLPQVITVGSKNLTLKVADLEGKPYKGKLTWELEALDSSNSFLQPGVVTLSSGGVLKTSVGISKEFPIRIRAIGADLRRTEWVNVTLVPPVESFYVSWDNYSPNPQNEGLAPDGAVKRKDPIPWEVDVAWGDIYLYACSFLPSDARQEVSWSIQVSSKVASWEFDESGTPVIHPKAPGKLTFTATAKDGSGAKYTGSIEFFGTIRQLEFEHTDTPIVKGGQSFTFRVKAWYDDAKTLPVANPKVTWEYHGDEEFASINSKGVLTVSKNISMVSGGEVEAICDECHVFTDILLRPADDLTPLIICEDPADPERIYSWGYSGIYVAAGTQMKISGMVYDANAQMNEESEVYTDYAPTSVTVKGAAYDKQTGILTVGNKENTKVTITATFKIGSTTKKVSLWFWVGIKADRVDVTTTSAPSGKTTRLSAVSTYQQGEERKECSQQKFTWTLHATSPELRGKTKLTKDGKLTVPKLDRPGWVFVGIEDSYGKGASHRITIEPIKQVKPTVEFYGWYDYFNSDTNTVAVNLLNPDSDYDLLVGSDYKVSVLIDGKDYAGSAVTVTDITSSKESIAAPVYDGDILKGFKFTGKTGSVVFTFRGVVNTGEEGAEPVPFTKAVTIKTVKAVTEVTLNGPLVGTIGKSLNLKPVVNKDATNKKLIWEIDEEDLDSPYDKTSIKNGVIKFDDSWYTESWVYTVICRSADGFYENQWEVTAEAAAKAVYVIGEDPVNGSETLYNGTTQTITRGQTLMMLAGSGTPENLVFQQTMTAKSSNSKVAVVYKMQNGNNSYWLVQGLKPGTATITFTANSGKKASFKVVVSKEPSYYIEVTGGVKPFQDTLITKKTVKFDITLHTPDGKVYKYGPESSGYFNVGFVSNEVEYFELSIDEKTGMLTISNPNYDPSAPLRRVDMYIYTNQYDGPWVAISFVTRANIPVTNITPD